MEWVVVDGWGGWLGEDGIGWGGGLGGWRWGERLGVGGLKRTEWGGQYGEDGTVYVERAAEVAQSIRYLSGMCVVCTLW